MFSTTVVAVIIVMSFVPLSAWAIITTRFHIVSKRCMRTLYTLFGVYCALALVASWGWVENQGWASALPALFGVLCFTGASAIDNRLNRLRRH